MSSLNETNTTLQQTRQLYHPDCVVCSAQHTQGLRIDYLPCEDGSVEATIDCPPHWQGYAGVVHGGIVSSLLDGAMTNCLFAQGVAAYTADLRVRFKRPLDVGHPARVTAKITRHATPIYELSAKIEQQGKVRALATGKFMAKDNEFQQLWKRD